MWSIQKDVQDGLELINIFNTYNSELQAVATQHPILTPAQKTSFLKCLSEDVDSNLAVARTILCKDPSNSEFMGVSSRIMFAKLMLMSRGRDLQFEETWKWDSKCECAVETAFLRLRRTEAFHTFLKQILHTRSQGNGMLEWYESFEGMDMFKTLLSTITTAHLVDIKDLLISRRTELPEEAICALCDCKYEQPSYNEPVVNLVPNRCDLLLLPCCKRVTHSCCMCARLRKKEQGCPQCQQKWSELDMARMVHARVYQLDLAIQIWGEEVNSQA